MESPNFNDLDDSVASPIRKDNSSIDLSRSSFSLKDRQFENKLNSSVILNKSMGISRYSINIEAQNDLGRITILLNDKEEGKDVGSTTYGRNFLDIDGDLGEINDDDLSSDMDKYSRCYETSTKRINFKELPDVRQTRSRFMDGDLLE